MPSERRVRGLAWTLDLDTAAGFAVGYDNRHGLGFPTVYRATVRADEIFFYTDDRGEREMVCRPRYPRMVPMSGSELKAASDRWQARIRANEERHLREWRSKQST
jgi:hypothetical protein